MRQSTDTCASCREFPLEDSMAHGGRAECRPRERPAVWNDRACVLYERDKNIRPRKVLVMQLHNEQQPKDK